jgi:transcription antitermination factor NusA-like protein/GTPase SAR1 family protein
MERHEGTALAAAGYHPRDRALQAALAAAARAASHALNAARPQAEALLATLQSFAARVQDLRVETSSDVNESIGAIISSFAEKYDALREMLDLQAVRATIDLSKAFDDLDNSSRFVTFMLFGRTKAGKSTTMEALTGGDGSSIGMGRQHTTTEVRAYYYPRLPDNDTGYEPALRIVDTPGIEGFDGDALASLAENFIEQSDHILFLLTDDKAGADELKRFGTIQKQGKSVTVLLNVKRSDQSLDLLISNPSLVFCRDEIEGHVRRIESFLKENLAMPAPRIIPFHARGAWLSQRPEHLPDGVRDVVALRKESRLSDLESWIEHFIQHEAIPARLKAPKDLLLNYVTRQKNALRPVAGEFRKVTSDLEDVARRLRDGTRRASTRATRRLPLLRARFQAAADAVPGMVDEVIATGGRGLQLDGSWQALLREHGVTSALQWFVGCARSDFRDEIAANVEEASFDYSFTTADGTGDMLGRYYEAEGAEPSRRLARAAIRTGGATASGALATWAVANIWNPTGWAAALAAAVVVGVAGIAGEELARKATDEWERSSRKDMYAKRDAIIAKLRGSLWRDHQAVNVRCAEWLDEIKQTQTLMIETVARPVRDASRELWQATVRTLDELDAIAMAVNEGLIRDLFTTFVPESEQGKVVIAGVVRELGYRTKVMVSAASAGVNPIAICVGRQGSRISRISGALNHERVDLVDAEADVETKVAQALGLRKTDATISTAVHRGQQTACVRIASQSLARAMYGRRGSNMWLASQLIGVDIEILEA